MLVLNQKKTYFVMEGTLTSIKEKTIRHFPNKVGPIRFDSLSNNFTPLSVSTPPPKKPGLMRPLKEDSPHHQN